MLWQLMWRIFDRQKREDFVLNAWLPEAMSQYTGLPCLESNSEEVSYDT